MTPEIDKAVWEVLKQGYSISFKVSHHDERGANFTFTILCPDGCGYGRGLRFDDYQNNPNCRVFTEVVEMLAYSILKTIEHIPERESNPNKIHDKAVETANFSL